MIRSILIWAVCASMGGLIPLPAAPEISITTTFTGTEMAWSWGMSHASCHFRDGEEVIFQATPASLEGNNDLLKSIPASELTLSLMVKIIDKSSAKLFEAMESKRIFPSVKLALMGTVGDKRIQVAYLMSDVIVSRIVPRGEESEVIISFKHIAVT